MKTPYLIAAVVTTLAGLAAAVYLLALPEVKVETVAVGIPAIVGLTSAIVTNLFAADKAAKAVVVAEKNAEQLEVIKTDVNSNATKQLELNKALDKRVTELLAQLEVQRDKTRDAEDETKALQVNVEITRQVDEAVGGATPNMPPLPSKPQDT